MLFVSNLLIAYLVNSLGQFSCLLPGSKLAVVLNCIVHLARSHTHTHTHTHTQMHIYRGAENLLCLHGWHRSFQHWYVYFFDVRPRKDTFLPEKVCSCMCAAWNWILLAFCYYKVHAIYMYMDVCCAFLHENTTGYCCVRSASHAAVQTWGVFFFVMFNTSSARAPTMHIQDILDRHKLTAVKMW